MAEFTAAEESYRKARRKAFWHAIVDALTGQRNHLLAWDEVKDKLQIGGQIYRGVQAVPVLKIVGSVNRYQDFDRFFLPTQEFTAHRWRSISRAFYREEQLPPVELYKLDDRYFVLDGNHRVSVAREQGMEYIDAEVIEVESRGPIEPDLDAQDLEIRGEYAEFLRRTHLETLRPDHDIHFTIGGGYQRLLEHIAVHKYFMGLERQHPIEDDVGVTDWYDQVYLPLIQIIREQQVLREFPRRTEADLYLWVIDHLHYLRERHKEITAEEAAEHFAEQYTERPLKRALNRFQDLVLGTPSDPEEEPPSEP